MDEAPGWAAIEKAVARVYGEVEPYGHLGTQVPFSLGGPDPLDGISIFRRANPVPHWHLVGFGMSELYDKTGEDPEVSGFGFEFSARVADDGGDGIPMWAAVLLQVLARYVVGNRPFAPGHTIHVAPGTFGADVDTALTALAFAVDPDLGVIDTPHGSVTFLEVAALTEDEYAVAKGGNSAAVLERIAERAARPHIIDRSRGTLL